MLEHILPPVLRIVFLATLALTLRVQELRSVWLVVSELILTRLGELGVVAAQPDL